MEVINLIKKSVNLSIILTALFSFSNATNNDLENSIFNKDSISNFSKIFINEKTRYDQLAHDLEIFSEDGLKFKLMVNGKEINDAFDSNVKMENIQNDQLNVKIVFEDESITALERKYLQIGDPGIEDSAPVSTVYKIVNKKGSYKIRFVSRTEKKIQTNVIILKDN